MDSINQKIYLNDTELWELTNSTMVAHPFHIHDVEFFVLDINGNPPPAEYAGYKDVILVKPNDIVRFITRFTTFANNSVPYMYHCHLFHHEDDGMMATFLVLDTNQIVTQASQPTFSSVEIKITPQPAADYFFVQNNHDYSIQSLELIDLNGKKVFYKTINNSSKTIKIEIPPQLVNGLYLACITTKEGIIAKKISIKR
jgi:bilirubin oxidase